MIKKLNDLAKLKTNPDKHRTNRQKLSIMQVQ